MKYQFYIRKFENALQYSVICDNYAFQLVLNYFFDLFNNLNYLFFLKEEIRKNVSQEFGNNDFSIVFFQDKVTFDLLFDKSNMDIEEVLPFVMHKDEFDNFLNKTIDFMVKFESCQIPGIIPESKLDTWACVPKEYVKEEYWELQKQKEGENQA